MVNKMQGEKEKFHESKLSTERPLFESFSGGSFEEMNV